MPFQPGNQEGKKSTKPKPFRDALRLELAAAGEDHKKLREIASKLIAAAASGDLHAIKEIADRTDGKPAQAIVGGDDEDNPVRHIHEVRRIIVDPRDTDSEGVPPAAQASEI